MGLRAGMLVFCAGLGWACSSAVPTDTPGVSAAGDHVRLYEGPELEVAIGTGYAAEHLGEDCLVLGASVAGAGGGGVVEVDRSVIFVQTPDRRKIRLMTQEEYRERYGKLVAATRRVETFSPSLLESKGTRRPCHEWFFREPTVGFARDVLTISTFDVCDGVLFFLIPGGVQAGRWELEIRLEESVVEIPFFLD